MAFLDSCLSEGVLQRDTSLTPSPEPWNTSFWVVVSWAYTHINLWTETSFPIWFRNTLITALATAVLWKDKERGKLYNQRQEGRGRSQYPKTAQKSVHEGFVHPLRLPPQGLENGTLSILLCVCIPGSPASAGKEYMFNLPRLYRKNRHSRGRFAVTMVSGAVLDGGHTISR